jgi:hypothetical protein
VPQKATAESEAAIDDDESHRSPRQGKLRQVTGENVAEKIATAKHAQARLPWYLRTSYQNDELNMEFDGVVKAGTVRALVERLTAEQLSEYFTRRQGCVNWGIDVFFQARNRRRRIATPSSPPSAHSRPRMTCSRF